MKLLGAREFIKMPAGTFYIQYWQNTTEECFDVINKFILNPTSLLDISPDNLNVFGDNSGSMSFCGYECEDDDDDENENSEYVYINYYDANVVGDASPATTLYLVINEDELPAEIEAYDKEYNIVKLSKDDVIRIRDIFVNEIFERHNYNDVWALKELDRISSSGNRIVDTKLFNEM